MKKQTLLLALLILIVTGSIFAVEVSGTWYWATDDWNIQYFRYQLDGELEGNWTIVDSNVYSVTIDGLDGDVEHTLFVQQSYDGKTWSESAQASSDIYVTFDDSWEAQNDEEATDFWDLEEPNDLTLESDLNSPVDVPEMEVPVTIEDEKTKPEIVEKVDKPKTLRPYLYRNELGIGLSYRNSVQVDNKSFFNLFLSYKSISAFGIIKDYIGLGFLLQAGVIGDDFKVDSINFQFIEGPALTWYSGKDLVFNISIGFQQNVALDFGQILLSGAMEIGFGVKLNESLFMFGNLTANYIPSENQQDLGITFQLSKSY